MVREEYHYDVDHDWDASFDRITKTMMGEEPDRVPLLYLPQDQIMTRVTGMSVREILKNPENIAKAAIKTSEFLGMDAVVLFPGYAGPYQGKAFADVNEKSEYFKWFKYSTPFLEQGKLCQTPEDIRNLQVPANYNEIEPFCHLPEAAEIIREETGQNPNARLFGPCLTWSNVQMLRGLKAYRDQRKNPELLLELCEKIYESQWNLYEWWKEEIFNPLAAINFQYAFNANMMSFEDAWKYEGQFVERFSEESELPIIAHNCGMEPYWEKTTEKLDLMGVNGSHPLDLEYWVEFREKYPEVIIAGASIYVNDEMLTGTQKEVKVRVKENIQKIASKNPRFVACPICCPPWGVPLENYKAVKEAVRKYGEYPIQK